MRLPKKCKDAGGSLNWFIANFTLYWAYSTAGLLQLCQTWNFCLPTFPFRIFINNKRRRKTVQCTTQTLFNQKVTAANPKKQRKLFAFLNVFNWWFPDWWNREKIRCWLLTLQRDLKISTFLWLVLCTNRKCFLLKFLENVKIKTNYTYFAQCKSEYFLA